jgi:ribosomal protein S18 acetylase RimI-like enzyme
VLAEVRRVTPEDWEALRSLRLEALANYPIGFCERLTDAERHSDEHWRLRAARGAEGGDSYQVLAFDDGRPVGTSVTFTDERAAWVAAVYVAPSHRGQGLLARMLDELADWQRGRGATELLLEVHEDNARARAAYRRLGFVETGERRPYPLDESRDELLMALPLAGPARPGIG